MSLENELEKIPLPVQVNKNQAYLNEVKSEIESIIGLENVKEFVYQLENHLVLQQFRESQGHQATRLSMHMVFAGNPGTGKTTVARLIAKYLKVLGYLSSGHLVEAGREKLVGEYIGHTAPKTQAVLEAAKGGVLFIDEAYSLARGNTNDFGKEAVDTLVKGMDDYRDDLVVIMAGYTNEMEDLLKMNPGLRSRINHTIEFNDYSPEEMLQIAQFTAESKGYIISTDCENGLKGVFEKRQIPGKNDAGNRAISSKYC